MKSVLIIFIIIVATGSVLLYLNLTKDNDGPESIVEHHLVVEKINEIGKVELIKLYIRDVVEHTEVKEWYLPNSRVVLIISGEVVGCIDLQKIDSTDITVTPNGLSIKLPQPEICYFKINHQDSKVYNIENEYFEKAKLIDKAYTMAEQHLQKAALEMKIHDQTKKSAERLLKPLLESFAGKKVEFSYDIK